MRTLIVTLTQTVTKDERNNLLATLHCLQSLCFHTLGVPGRMTSVLFGLLFKHDFRRLDRVHKIFRSTFFGGKNVFYKVEGRIVKS